MYDNATKDTWRGWAWNQVAARIPKGGTVIVLAGDGGFDLDVGRKKGFEVVGMDLCEDHVSTFRKKGGVAIQDNVYNQIHLLKPDAVILDMKGNLSNRSFFDGINKAFFYTRCVVFNGMRGRKDLVTDRLRNMSELTNLPEYKFVKGKFRQIGTDPGKLHRGKIGLMLIHDNAYHVVDESTDEARWSKDGTRWSYEKSWNGFVHRIKPSFYSYKSKDSGNATLVYDSFAGFGYRGTVEHFDGFNELEKHYLNATPKRSLRKSRAAKALLTMQRQRN